jgi:hypothetical protein
MPTTFDILGAVAFGVCVIGILGYFPIGDRIYDKIHDTENLQHLSTDCDSVLRELQTWAPRTSSNCKYALQTLQTKFRPILNTIKDILAKPWYRKIFMIWHLWHPEFNQQVTSALSEFVARVSMDANVEIQSLNHKSDTLQETIVNGQNAVIERLERSEDSMTRLASELRNVDLNGILTALSEELRHHIDHIRMIQAETLAEVKNVSTVVRRLEKTYEVTTSEMRDVLVNIRSDVGTLLFQVSAQRPFPQCGLSSRTDLAELEVWMVIRQIFTTIMSHRNLVAYVVRKENTRSPSSQVIRRSNRPESVRIAAKCKVVLFEFAERRVSPFHSVQLRFRMPQAIEVVAINLLFPSRSKGTAIKCTNADLWVICLKLALAFHLMRVGIGNQSEIELIFKGQSSEFYEFSGIVQDELPELVLNMQKLVKIWAGIREQCGENDDLDYEVQCPRFLELGDKPALVQRFPGDPFNLVRRSSYVEMHNMK